MLLNHAYGNWQCLTEKWLLHNIFGHFFLKNGRGVPIPEFFKNGHRALTLDIFKKSQAF